MTSARLGVSTETFAEPMVADESVGTPVKAGDTSSEGSASGTAPGSRSPGKIRGLGGRHHRRKEPPRCHGDHDRSQVPLIYPITLLVHRGAEQGADRIRNGMKGLLCRNIPFDNGREFAGHQKKSPKGWVQRCTSSIRTVLGKGAPKRTQTASSGNICPSQHP
jgi:hypothetical protein